MARLERERDRRRMARAFLAGASTMLLAGLALWLVTGALAWVGRPEPALAGKAAAQRLIAE